MLDTLTRIRSVITAAAQRVATVHEALIQLAGCASVVVGIAMWSIPSALIVAGVAAVAAIEIRAGQ